MKINKQILILFFYIFNLILINGQINLKIKNNQLEYTPYESILFYVSKSVVLSNVDSIKCYRNSFVDYEISLDSGINWKTYFDNIYSSKGIEKDNILVCKSNDSIIMTSAFHLLKIKELNNINNAFFLIRAKTTSLDEKNEYSNVISIKIRRDTFIKEYEKDYFELIENTFFENPISYDIMDKNRIITKRITKLSNIERVNLATKNIKKISKKSKFNSIASLAKYYETLNNICIGKLYYELSEENFRNKKKKYYRKYIKMSKKYYKKVRFDFDEEFELCNLTIKKDYSIKNN